jgi:hypothetical protein
VDFESTYSFDLNGFVVLRDVIPPDHVERLNSAIDNASPRPTTENPTIGLNDCLDWDQSFVDLIDNQAVLPYLAEWVDPAVRLDSVSGFTQGRGAPAIALHLGGTPYRRVAYHHTRDGRIFSGLFVVSYALSAVKDEGGGFCCIPGSHKAMFPLPETVGTDSPLVHQVAVEPGDAILFTEALTHGTLPWTSDWARRVLFYRYAPAHVRFDLVDWSAAILSRATERQRSMLEGPYVRSGLRRRSDLDL